MFLQRPRDVQHKFTKLPTIQNQTHGQALSLTRPDQTAQIQNILYSITIIYPPPRRGLKDTTKFQKSQCLF